MCYLVLIRQSVFLGYLKGISFLDLIMSVNHLALNMDLFQCKSFFLELRKRKRENLGYVKTPRKPPSISRFTDHCSSCRMLHLWKFYNLIPSLRSVKKIQDKHVMNTQCRGLLHIRGNHVNLPFLVHFLTLRKIAIWYAYTLTEGQLSYWWK